MDRNQGRTIKTMNVQVSRVRLLSILCIAWLYNVSFSRDNQNSAGQNKLHRQSRSPSKLESSNGFSSLTNHYEHMKLKTKLSLSQIHSKVRLSKDATDITKCNTAKDIAKKSIRADSGLTLSDASDKTSVWSNRTIERCPSYCSCTYRSSTTIDVVDCTNRRLVEIPLLPSTATVVYLQNNEISKVSCTSFKKMKSLLKLNLSQNKISRLSRCSFVHLAALQSLDLNKNLLRKIENNTFQSLGSLNSLSLKGNSLRYLPGTFDSLAFQGLNSLTHLHLEGNEPDLTENFTYPDQALAQVTTLQRIWLDGHPRVLGPGFLVLLQLSYISFTASDGGFCTFQSDLPVKLFSNLGTRKPLTLDMSKCSINSIPPLLFSYVPNIYSLDLSFNTELSIYGFESGSEGLNNSSLTILTLNEIVQKYTFNSEITETSFQYLRNTSLKFLSLEGNKLINLHPRAIFDLPLTVEYLSFYRNSIVSGYGFFTTVRLQNLKTFKVSFDTPDFSISRGQNFRPFFKSKDIKTTTSNTRRSSVYKTDKVDVTIGDILHHTNIQYGDTTHASHRNIKRKEFCEHTGSIHGPFPLAPKLEKFYWSGYKFANGIPEITIYRKTVLEYLDLSNNGFKCFGGPLHGPKSLVHLDISKNWAFQLNPYFFSDMAGIKTLLLSQNRFGRPLKEDAKGVTFSNLTRLETLDLSDNVIEVLSEQAFENNRNLKVLNLSNNAINNFTPSLAFNLHLLTLDLSFNPLQGLSKSTCLQLHQIKHRNPNFVLKMTGVHGFSCGCAQLYFLDFLLREPGIFEDMTSSFSCRLPDGSQVSYARLPEVLPMLALHCRARSIFLIVFAVFFLLAGSLVVFGFYNYKRWQWRYLHHIGKSRLHIGSTHVTYKPVAQAFITYDQEDASMRRVMRNIVLPRLRELEVSTVVGELDFVGGPLAPSIAGAVASTCKTVVFLTPDIFQDSHRRLEVNLAIMHELELCKPVLVPVLVFSSRAKHTKGRVRGGYNQLVPEHSMMEVINDTPRARRYVEMKGPTRRLEEWRDQVGHEEDFIQFQRLLRKFPPEISTFLEGQIHRCLVFTGHSDNFWRSLKQVILEE